MKAARGDNGISVIVSAEKAKTDETELGGSVFLPAIRIRNVSTAVRLKFAAERCHAGIASSTRIVPRAIASFVRAFYLELSENLLKFRLRGNKLYLQQQTIDHINNIPCCGGMEQNR